MKYDNNMDEECVNLCDAINLIPGLRTIESCCGHDEGPFRIWFDVGEYAALPILLYYCDPCHVGFRWWCKVTTDCAMSPVTHYIESCDVGSEAYAQAKTIASELNEYVDEGLKCDDRNMYANEAIWNLFKKMRQGD